MAEEKYPWDSVEEKVGGSSFDTLSSGAYACVITGASYGKSKSGGRPMLELVWDVAEGPHKDHFASPFFENKQFRHTERLMLDRDGLGYTKHKVHTIADANPGFKPTVAIDSGQTQPFVGKRCYLLLQERKYTYNGRDQSEVNVVRWLFPDEFKNGDFKVPETIDDRESTAPAAPVAAPAPVPQPAFADEDIPF